MPEVDPTEAVRELRQRALSVRASELGIVPTEEHPHAWAVLMETGYPEAVVTLVVVADGATSLYFSSGGGIIGAGVHPTVRAASEQLLSAVESQIRDFATIVGDPLPEVGRVRFYVRTFKATLSAEATEAGLGGGAEKLSPVFFAAHDVITAVRESTAE